MAEGAVRVYELVIDPDLETGIDVAVVTTTPGIGLLRMREGPSEAWIPLTDDPNTTFRVGNLTGPTEVDLEASVPTGDPRELVARIVYDLAGGLVASP